MSPRRKRLREYADCEICNLGTGPDARVPHVDDPMDVEVLGEVGNGSSCMPSASSAERRRASTIGCEGR